MLSSCLRSGAVIAFILSSHTLRCAVMAAEHPRPDTFDSEVEALLRRLSVQDKIRLIHGLDSMAWGKLSNAGIPRVGMNDGPQGVRGPAATQFPSGLAMAATWNPALVGEAAKVMGLETLANKNRIHLGPAVNIMRTPLGGRTFEYMGEDPLLAGKIAAGYVRGLQSTGVAASLKHFVCNDQETDRTTVSVEVSERALREIYLKPFEIVVREAYPWTIMASYNKLRGRWACENAHLLQQILRTEWSYDGVVMSDWGAWHDTARSVAAGADLDMPGREEVDHAAVELELVRSGKIDPKQLDNAVRRNLRLMFRTGGTGDAPAGQATNEAHQAVARRVAAESIVLLKNDRAALPLDANAIKTLAIIGPGADWSDGGRDADSDGGSGRVFPPHTVSPLAGLRAALGEKVKILHVAGYDFGEDLAIVPAAALRPSNGSTEQGLRVDWFANPRLEGPPTATGASATIDALYESPPAPGIPLEDFSARWTGQLVPPVSGDYTLGVSSDDGSRLFLNGKLIVDNWDDHAERTRSARVQLEAGKPCDVVIEYYNAKKAAIMRFGWRLPENPAESGLASAARAAAQADAAIVCVGITHRYDHEGADKPNMQLMGPANELVRAVLAANSRTIVVLTNGSPVDVEAFADAVPAVVEHWYPGMEGGHALADVLLGKVNPSGRLPITFGRKPADYRAHTFGPAGFPGEELVVEYRDDVFVGYRHFDDAAIEPRYAFGHGLGYSTFEYQNLTVTPDGAAWKIAFDLKNSGSRDGAEVPQLYLGKEASVIRRAPRELKAFEKVYLQAGASRRVEFSLTRQDLAYWDEAQGGWHVTPGRYAVEVGSSSRALPLKGSMTVKEP